MSVVYLYSRSSLLIRSVYRAGFRRGITRLYVHIVSNARTRCRLRSCGRSTVSPREFQVSTYLQNTPDIRPSVISVFGYGRIIRQKSERINVNELKLSTSPFLHVSSVRNDFSLLFLLFFFSRFSLFFFCLRTLKRSIDRGKMRNMLMIQYLNCSLIRAFRWLVSVYFFFFKRNRKLEDQYESLSFGFYSRV